MAIAFRDNGIVVKNTTTGIFSATTSPFATNLNDMIVVVVSLSQPAFNLVTSVVDLAGNIYTNIPGATIRATGIVRLEVWVSLANSSNSSNTVTVTTGSPCTFVATASSYSGVGSIGNSGSSIPSTPNPTQSIVTGNSGDWIVGGFAGSGTGTFSSGSGNNFSGVTSSGLINQDVGGGIADNGPGLGLLSVFFTNPDTQWALGLIILEPLSDQSWEPIPDPNLCINLNYSMVESSVGQIRPTLATLPNSSSDLTQSGTPTVRLQYAKPDFVSQTRPTLATLPSGTATGLVPDSRRSNLSRYAASESFVSPPKFGLTVASLFKLDGRYVSERYPFYRGRFAAPDFVNQTRPTLATLPGFAWIPSTQASFFSRRGYSRSVADVGVGLAPAPIVLGDWSSTQGQTAVNLNNAPSSDYTAQVKIPNPPLTNFAADLSKYYQQNAVVLSYSNAEEFVDPPKLNLPTPLYPGWQTTTGRVFSSRGYSRAVADVGVNVKLSLVSSGWLVLIGQQSLPQNYAEPDFVHQDKPTLATLPVLLSGRAEVPWSQFPDFLRGDTFTNPDKATTAQAATLTIASWQPNSATSFGSRGYSRAVSDTGVSANVLAVVVLGWLSLDAQKSPSSKFLQGDNYSSPPKFGLIQAAVQTISGWTANIGNSSIVLDYVQCDYVNQSSPSKVLTSLGFLPYVSANAQLQKFAPVDWIAPAKFGIVTVAAPTIASWLPTISLTFGSRGYSRAVSDVSPGIAPVASVTFVAVTDGQKSAGVDFLFGDSFTAPPKFGIVVAAPITMDNWIPTTGQRAVTLNYAMSDFTTPAKFGLVVIAPSLVSSWLPTISLVLSRRGYSRSVAETAPGTVPPIVVQTYAWRGEDVYSPKFDWYSQGDTSTGPSATASVQQAFTQETIGQSSLSKMYASTSWSAPDKFSPAPPISPTINSWKSTDGQPVVVLKYAPDDYVNQIRPTLATLASGTSFLAFVAVNAQPQKFASTDWTAPTKFGQIVPVIPPLIPAWFSTDGKSAVILAYTLGSSVQPDKQFVQTTFISGWLGTDGKSAVQLEYAPGSWIAPEKLTATVVVSVFSWRGEDGYYPKFDWYSQGDTSTGPSSVASVQQAFTQETLGQKSLGRNYAPTTWTAPDRFGLIAQAIVFLPSWKSTDGQNAVTLKYAPVDWSAPAKFGIIAPAPITISNWFGTDGQHAVVLKYAPTDYVNQVKPTLATLPSSTSYLDFIGPKAQPQKFATPDYVNQTAPTLATLPNGIATDFTVFGRRANPPTFSAGDIFTAPGEFGLSFIPGSILVRGVVFYKVVTANANVNTRLVQTIVVNGVVVKIVLVE